MITISKSHPDRQGIEYVIRALDRDKSRLVLQYILVKKTNVLNAIASDGHRLHMYKNMLPDIPEGLYSYSEIKGSKDIILLPVDKEDTGEYPDCLKTIPRKWKKKVKVGGANLGRKKAYYSGSFEHVVGKVFRALDESESINLNYLSDALVDGEEFDVKIGEPLSPILFVNHKYLAVVMPMRM
jgi:hypothetical protein